MTPEELTLVFRYALSFGFAGVIAGGICFLLLKAYLPSYLSEKAKNLATREDVAKITHEVEEVKLQFSLALEGQKVAHQLRLAAIDRRLQAHQEAFTLWREVVANAYSDEIGKTVLKCQKWWEENCLYLEPEVREAFVQSYSAAHSHRTLVGSRPAADIVSEHWARVTRAGDLIFTAVQLPALSSVEKGDLEKIQSSIATPPGA